MRTPTITEPPTSTAVIDRLMMVAAVVHPLTTIPQVVKIYATHQAQSLSIATWFMYCIIGAIFLAYAVVHKIRPLIFNQVIWFIMDGLVLTGILLYGN